MQIDFFPDTHEYLVDGILTPSVTTLIKLMPEFQGMYKGVSASVLKSKAEYGDRIHELIECVGRGGEAPEVEGYEAMALKRFITLKEQYDIQIESSEECIAYYHDGLPLFAGKYDLYGTIEKRKALIDIKTTSKYHQDYLAVQLSAYKLALDQMGRPVGLLGCLWMPKKGLGRLNFVDSLPEKVLLEKLIDASQTYKRQREILDNPDWIG